MKIYREMWSMPIVTQPDEDGFFRPVYEIEVDEAELIRHGKWDDKIVAFYRVCSECGAVVRQNTNAIFLNSCMSKVGRLNYCPNCGAKMNEVSE